MNFLVNQFKEACLLMQDLDHHLIRAYGYKKEQLIELLLGIALKTISNYLDRLSPAPLDQALAEGIGTDFMYRKKGKTMKLLTTVLLTITTAFAQSSDRLPVTDPEKIADALRAGPAFITKDATLLDWPSAPAGEYRFLRKGTNEWTCLPGIPGYPHDAFDSAFKEEPGCYDPTFLRWMQDSLAGRTPHIDRIGISYMYLGAWKSAKDGHEFHVGPHLMVVGPHQDEFQGFSRDATDGMPYVTHLPNRTELFLVMPVRQWYEHNVHE